MHRTNQVFSRRCVYRRLSADRTVHLREQRRRHLHIRDSAVINRRHEPGKIADDAATERNDKRRTIQSRGQPFTSRKRHRLASAISISRRAEGVMTTGSCPADVKLCLTRWPKVVAQLRSEIIAQRASGKPISYNFANLLEQLRIDKYFVTDVAGTNRNHEG